MRHSLRHCVRDRGLLVAYFPRLIGVAAGFGPSPRVPEEAFGAAVFITLTEFATEASEDAFSVGILRLPWLKNIAQEMSRLSGRSS